MTHDEMIARGIWSGDILAMRARMAEFTVDGERLGAMELVTKSGSPNDVHLDKRTSEIVTAAMLLSRLGHERVKLSSLDEDGVSLESPDLDAQMSDGLFVGIEVADVLETSAGKHNASRNAIEVLVGDLIDSDPGFAAAFGNWYFSLTLSGMGPQSALRIGSKKEAQAIAQEVVSFIRSEEHAVESEDSVREFPPEYETLNKRGAQFQASPMEGGPYFSMSEGVSTIGHIDHRGEVLRVLDKHRQQALKYRTRPIWMILFLTEWSEFFHNTIAQIVKMRPPITPFERVYLMDSAGRLEGLQ